MPEAVIAELPAVIAPEHDDGVVREAFLVERIEHLADLRVGVADARVVAVTQRLREVGGNRIFLRHAEVVVQLAVVVSGKLRATRGR